MFGRARSVVGFDMGSHTVKAIELTPSSRAFNYTNVTAQARQTPPVADVGAFALQNAYGLDCGFELGRAVGLINVGTSALNINILQEKRSIIPRARTASLGGYPVQ